MSCHHQTSHDGLTLNVAEHTMPGVRDIVNNATHEDLETGHILKFTLSIGSRFSEHMRVTGPYDSVTLDKTLLHQTNHLKKIFPEVPARQVASVCNVADQLGVSRSRNLTIVSRKRKTHRNPHSLIQMAVPEKFSVQQT